MCSRIRRRLDWDGVRSANALARLQVDMSHVTRPGRPSFLFRKANMLGSKFPLVRVEIPLSILDSMLMGISPRSVWSASDCIQSFAKLDMRPCIAFLLIAKFGSNSASVSWSIGSSHLFSQYFTLSEAFLNQFTDVDEAWTGIRVPTG